MNTYIKILAILIVTIIFAGCNVRDGEDPCPPEEGNVRINLYVEKFQNRSEDPLADREILFCERVNHIRYYLYKNDALYDEGIVDKFENTSIGFYTFDLDDLETGNYNLVVVANCTKNALTGDPSNANNLLLTYQGSADTEDYFTTVFPFTVTGPELREYVVGLSRTHGVVRYTFNNLPNDAIAVGVLMENVGSEKWITGQYKQSRQADMRYAIVPVTRQYQQFGDYIMGTFPTPTEQRSKFSLSLYRDGEEKAYRSEMIVDTLNIRRNQLLDIVVTYNNNNGEFDYEIILDSTWDGSNSGGEVGIQ